MTDLLTALRAKYREPKDVLRALALDENLLREPKDKDMPKPSADVLERVRNTKLAQDANLKDILELIDALKGANPEVSPEEEEPEEEEREELEDDETPADEDEEHMDENSGLPQFGGNEEEKKEVGHDNEEGKQGEIKALLAKLMELIGGEEKPAIDEACDEEPEEEKKPVDLKPAMDAAVKAIEARVLQNAREVRAAERDVRPYVGELAMDAKNAEEVYRAAAKAMGIDGADKIHASALPTLIKMQPKPGSAPRKEFAMDASAAKEYAERFPDANRLKRA